MTLTELGRHHFNRIEKRQVARTMPTNPLPIDDDQQTALSDAERLQAVADMERFLDLNGQTPGGSATSGSSAHLAATLGTDAIRTENLASPPGYEILGELGRGGMGGLQGPPPSPQSPGRTAGPHGRGIAVLDFS